MPGLQQGVAAKTLKGKLVRISVLRLQSDWLSGWRRLPGMFTTALLIMASQANLASQSVDSQ